MTDSTPPTRRSSDQEPSASGGGNGRGLSSRMLAKLKLVVEGYELFERIGTGGQATVYRGVQLKDDRIVAIKILHSGPHATKEARTRLKREIAALRALKHPNIVQAIAAGRTRSGLNCLVMNYIDGRPLDALWEDSEFAESIGEGISQPAARLRLFKKICETVQAAHRKGITHRDLSPSNILIDKEGEPHILDFGMASTAFDGIVSHDVTVTGQFIGKLKYASPEQAKGAGADDQGVDIRSDVYALGVMLYQLLTDGAFPYEVVGNVIDVLNNIIYSQPKPPSQTLADVQTRNRSAIDAKGFARRTQPLVNETIEAIVLKALEKDPQQRYQSAGELAADIDRYLTGQPTSAAVWPKHKKIHKKFIRSHRVAIIAASVILTTILIGVTMNAKAIAVYLGLTTVVAPVLPPEVSPFPQQTAEAGVLLEAEFLPDSMAGDRRLNQLADDLAMVEASLLAVTRQLDAIGIEQPSLKKRPSRGPMDVDAFTDQLAQASTDSGRTLAFTVMSKEDREIQEQYEADDLSRETNEEVLLAKRQELDEQQAALWAQIAYGTFTGRDINRIFRYRTKQTEPMSEVSAFREKVIDSGVKVRRTIDAALRFANETIGSGGGLEVGDADLGFVLGGIADQTKDSLSEFRSTIVDLRDVGTMADEDYKAMNELAGLAKDLIDSLDGAAESQARLTTDTGEMSRLINRGRLQGDLLDAIAAAAEFDQGLVELAEDWEIEVNTDLKLRPMKPAASFARQQPKVERSSRDPGNTKKESPAAALTVGSTWSGWAVGQYDGKTTRNYKDRVKIIKKSRRSVVLRTSRSVPNSYLLWTFRINGNELVLTNVAATGDAAATYSVREGGGTIDGDTLKFHYVNDNYRNGKFVSTSSATLTLKRDEPFQAKETVADPLSAWQPGSRWVNSTPGTPGNVDWTVVLRDADEIVIERDSVSGQGTVRVTCSIRGKKLRVTNVQHVNTRSHVSNREPRGSGTIKSDALTLTYSTISGNKSRWTETLNLSPE